uniref:Uncharacterized protein n=1 Tax=Anopheles quadriannulatus TaxID=34691 RepID=A0A182WSP7_ANOQN
MCHHGPGPGLPPGAGAGPVTVGVVGPGGAGPGMGTLVHGPSQLSLHGPPLPPPPLCNPCSNTNSFNSVPLPGPSRWGPRTSCPLSLLTPELRFCSKGPSLNGLEVCECYQQIYHGVDRRRLSTG